MGPRRPVVRRVTSMIAFMRLAGLLALVLLPGSASAQRAATATVHVSAIVAAPPVPPPVARVGVPIAVKRVRTGADDATVTLHGVLALEPAAQRTVTMVLPAAWRDSTVAVWAGLTGGAMRRLAAGSPVTLAVPTDAAPGLAFRVMHSDRRRAAYAAVPVEVTVLAQDADVTREARFTVPLAP